MITDDAAYPPLNIPKAIAEGVWIIDAKPIRAMNVMVVPLRMTIFKLGNGDLLIYSPTHYRETLRAAIEKLGPIKHLVAPSTGHWMFVKEWQEKCAEAKTWAVPELGKPKGGTRCRHPLRRPARPAATRGLGWRDRARAVSRAGLRRTRHAPQGERHAGRRRHAARGARRQPAACVARDGARRRYLRADRPGTGAAARLAHAEPRSQCRRRPATRRDGAAPRCAGPRRLHRGSMWPSICVIRLTGWRAAVR